MGLEVGKLPLLTLKDFRTGQWENEKNIYPVKIRLEVSGYYDYTTFIGADAKNVSQQYFREKQITSENDHPWKYERAGSFQHYFKRNCKGVGIYEKGKISPKSLQKRLKNILKDSECHMNGSIIYSGIIHIYVIQLKNLMLQLMKN